MCIDRWLKYVYPLCTVGSYSGSGGVAPTIVNVSEDGCEW